MNKKIALVGNPNTGKSSIFNLLTGLHQKTSNYPGVTVDKKVGICSISNEDKIQIMDLPGSYSLSSYESIDQRIVVDTLTNRSQPDYPDMVVVVADIKHLKRNLLIYTQIIDLGLPTILAINMSDVINKKGIRVDIDRLKNQLEGPVVLISARKNEGIDQLKALISTTISTPKKSTIDLRRIESDYFENLQKQQPKAALYFLWLKALKEIDNPSSDISLKKQLHKASALRYQYLNAILKDCYDKDSLRATDLRGRLDRILMHPIYGYLIFVFILGIIFQTIYNWNNIPTDIIDSAFTNLSSWVSNHFASGTLTSLLSEGIIPGIGGIALFVPQIVLLFFFITILEDSGYISRVIFLMDKTMYRFGLSGKSVIPLISGAACAIPAIMAARHIDNQKERLLTMLVIPFTTCSARLPVYLIIIAIVIPDQYIWGLQLQGLVLLALYLLGFLGALLASYLLNRFIKVQGKSSFVVEIPDYQIPIAKNVAFTIFQKTKSFIFGAGKIILSISIILWFLASRGPSNNFERAEEIVKSDYPSLSTTELENKISAYKLEHSYIGVMGHAIEPIIRPLGYDWKIGIALITSFAAREVFIGTLATIYSIGDNNTDTIQNKMAQDKNKRTGKPLFNLASGISLLLFYAFAMQCMSTLAVVRRETGSWRWPLMQLCYMSLLAYLSALIAYQTIIPII